MKKFKGFSLLSAMFAVCLTAVTASAEQPPAVTYTVPAAGASSVPVNNQISATFTEAMDPSTITTSTFTLRRGAMAVAGTVTYIGTTATFSPVGGLAPFATFTATITTGAKDLAGNLLTSNYVWSFATGAIPDTTPPAVTHTIPAAGASGVPVNNQISATFTEAMDPSTITTSTFTFTRGTTPVLGTVTYIGRTATFTPAGPLSHLDPFTAVITTGAKDLAGNALTREYVWNFATGAIPDTTPPTLTNTVPTIRTIGVPVNNQISATFTEAMDPSAMTTSTFTLRQGTTPISGTVAYIGMTVTFTPATRLSPLATFTATIAKGCKDLAGNALANNYEWSFTTGTIVDSTPPSVTSTVPAAWASGVAVNNALTLSFTEPMDPSTISTSTFILRQGATPVSGTVTYIGTIATFTPEHDLNSLIAGSALHAEGLPHLATFTATITTGAVDLAGNALASDYVWSFTTGATADTTPPTVISTVPTAGASNVAVNNSVAVTFSEAMDPSTITVSSFAAATFNLDQGATPVAGTVTYVGTTAIFAPVSSLSPLLPFTATVTIAAKDLAGNALAADYVWSFRTGVTADTTRPGVISTLPAAGASGVAVNSAVSVTFTEEMYPSTINTSSFTASSFTLRQGGTPVSGTVTYIGATATFTPLTGLKPLAPFTATIAAHAKDLAGNTLSSPFEFTFTTAAPVIYPAGTINSAGAVNVASYATTVAAGSIAGVFGSNLSIGQSGSQVSTPLSTTLAQSSFAIGGYKAPLYFASPGQVNLQIPWELAGQTQVPIRGTVDGVGSNTQMVTLAPFAPGIFTIDSTGTGQGAVLIVPTTQLAAPDTPVLRGEYVSIFCTGLGAVTNQPPTGAPAQADPLSFSLTTPTVIIGGVEARVSYAGLAPGFAGLYQVNAQVPGSVSPGSAVPLVISVGGAMSNTATMAVQ